RTLAGKIDAASYLDKQDIVFSGHVDAFFGDKMEPEGARMKLFARDGVLNLPDLYDAPLPYRDFVLEAIYNHEKRVMDISSAQITLNDATINAQANITHAENSAEGSVKVWLVDLPQEKIGPLWPVPLRDDNSKEWVVDRITGGTYTSAEATLGLGAAWGGED